MKTWIPFIAVFAAGVVLGVLGVSVYTKVTGPPMKLSDPRCTNAQGDDKIYCEMIRFQSELDSMGAPKSVDELSKQVEVRGGILELITKYRESEFAKYTPFSGLTGALIGAILGLFGPMLIGKRSLGADANSKAQ